MEERGSSKLGTLSPQDLHAAIDVARATYTVERWWKYGQPAIDRIGAVLNVRDPANAGSVIGGLAGQGFVIFRMSPASSLPIGRAARNSAIWRF